MVNKKIAKILMGLTASVLTAYFLIEGLSWLFMPPFYPANPSTDFIEKTPYLTESKEFRLITNNYGFRNAPDFNFPLTKKKPRVLLLGDSLIFGGPNTKSIDFFLSQSAPDYEFINAATPGGAPDAYYETLKFYYDKMESDYVFVGLFLGNDFLGPNAEQRVSLRYKAIQVFKKVLPNFYAFYKRQEMKNGSRRGEENLEPVSVSEFKQGTIKGVESLAKNLSLNPAPYLRRAESYDYNGLLERYPEIGYTKFESVLVNALVYRENIKEGLLLEGENALLNYEKDFQSVSGIVNFLKNKKSKLVFVIFPTSFIVDEKYAVFYRDLGYDIPPPSADHPLYKRLLGDLEKEGVNILDLHTLPDIKNLFFTEDWHITEKGNERVADEIIKWIK